MARSFLASALVLLIAGPAIAQPTGAPTPAPAPAPPPDDGGKTVDLPEDDTPSGDPTGVNENPDRPAGGLGGIDATVEPPPPPEPERKGYPIEETLRPITLPAMKSEVGLDIRNNVKPFASNTTLRGRFGVNRKVQIGLEYNIGGFYDDPGTVTDDKVKFNTGKSIGLDVSYLVFNWLAIRVALPFYLDPFATGITIGAPMKFRLGDKFAFGGMGDFLSIKLYNFVPSTNNELYNEINAIAVDTNTTSSAGSLRFTGFAIYQAKPNLAVGGEFAVLYEDFSDNNTPYSVRARAQYSTSSKLDFGGALGIGDLDDVGNSIQLNLYMQLRI
jgi:hypothetical protein